MVEKIVQDQPQLLIRNDIVLALCCVWGQAVHANEFRSRALNTAVTKLDPFVARVRLSLSHHDSNSYYYGGAPAYVEPRTTPFPPALMQRLRDKELIVQAAVLEVFLTTQSPSHSTFTYLSH